MNQGEKRRNSQRGLGRNSQRGRREPGAQSIREAKAKEGTKRNEGATVPMQQRV